MPSVLCAFKGFLFAKSGAIFLTDHPIRARGLTFLFSHCMIMFSGKFPTLKPKKLFLLFIFYRTARNEFIVRTTTGHASKKQCWSFTHWKEIYTVFQSDFTKKKKIHPSLNKRGIHAHTWFWSGRFIVALLGLCTRVTVNWYEFCLLRIYLNHSSFITALIGIGKVSILLLEVIKRKMAKLVIMQLYYL